jgi:glycosyltransferase involved in cell wall biosynthesis
VRDSEAGEILKILATATAYLPSTAGVQIHTHNIFKRLKGQGHHIRALSQWDNNRSDWLLGTTLLAPWKEKTYELEGIPVRDFTFTAWERLEMLPFVLPFYAMQGISIPAIAKIFLRKFREEGGDWDIVHSARIGRENISWASREMARSLGKPFVLTTYHHPRWVGYPYNYYRRMYREADHLIALTEVEKQVLVSLGAKPDSVSVTGMGPVLADKSDPQAYSAQLGLPAGAPVVLFLGQKFTYKGFRELYAAAPLVLKRYPGTQFLFIGPSSPESEKFFRGKQHPNIREIGRVSLEQKCSALRMCDLLCVPSSQESFGGVYTEAWSFEKPVIGCNIPAVSEVITDGTDGFLCDQNPVQIAEKILYYLDNPTTARAHGKAGYSKVQGKYTWDVIAEKTLAAFNKALRG